MIISPDSWLSTPNHACSTKAQATNHIVENFELMCEKKKNEAKLDYCIKTALELLAKV